MNSSWKFGKHPGVQAYGLNLEHQKCILDKMTECMTQMQMLPKNSLSQIEKISEESKKPKPWGSHPSALEFIYRIRNYTLGKSAACIISTNTEDISVSSSEGAGSGIWDGVLVLSVGTVGLVGCGAILSCLERRFLVSRRTANSGMTGGNHPNGEESVPVTPEITSGDNLAGVSVRAAFSKLIGSGVTGGNHSAPENRIVGRRTDAGDYRRL
ncbi:hypothetical protein GEV33_008794 [Tenebrio molitor]|uniref:Uncharacterized protein n=1 Tax=Tenebrio molitor TaxID=7067 RepID=A0A8J6LB96_TENMO|nr:hypothetical protein GEV33_008794 [Tenebrio molitor]